jgi:lysophospholipid acyltransferase (LPLAT)-like uncharacterized protein
MAEEIDPAFKFQPLDRYSSWQSFQIRVMGLGLYLLTKIVGQTMKFEVHGPEWEDDLETAGKKPIYSFWHDRIISSTYFFRDQDIIVLSSHSFDSEYTARCIQRFGFGIVKGSSSRGAVSGLVGLIRIMKRGFAAAFTVDGPRGPRYEVKSGPILLAKKTGNPLVPFVIECQRFWKLKSWDRLQIPKPFTTAAVFYGPAIYVDAKVDDDELESKRIELQNILLDLVKQGETWRELNI